MASVRKRTLPSGKTAWQADYVDQAGKRRSRQFSTKRAATEFLTTAAYEVRSGIHTADGSSITVAMAADLWLSRCETERLEESTVRQYRQHVTHHIAPLIGETKLSRLTAPVVDQWLQDLLKTRSRALTRKVRTSLVSLLSDAMRRGLVGQNVAANVKLAVRRAEAEAAVIPTKDQIRGLIAAADGFFRPLMLTAIFTGMRASELRGLEWRHVDFVTGDILIRQRADFRGRIGPPKARLAGGISRWRRSSPTPLSGGD